MPRQPLIPVAPAEAMPRWAWFLLGAVAVPIFFVGATVHEVVQTPAFYASLSRGIAETGVWFPVWHEGAPYALKPPLQLWLAAGAIGWLGPTSLAVTFWPRLLGLLCAGLTADVGRRMYGNRAGFFAGLAMVTNVTLVENAHTFRLDAGLLFGMMVATWALVALRGAWRAPVFFAGVSFAVLSKGPQGLLPLIVGLAWAIGQGRLVAPWHPEARPWLVSALLLLPALAWPLELKRRFGDEVLGQVSTDWFLLMEVDGVGDWVSQVVRKYVYQPLLFWLPFSPFMVLGTWRTLRSARAGPPEDTRAAFDRALLVWVVLTGLMLLLRTSHRGRYALLFLPPLALLGGRELARLARGRSPLRLAAALVVLAACMMASHAGLRPGFGWRSGSPERIAAVRGRVDAAWPDPDAAVPVLVSATRRPPRAARQHGIRDWVDFHLGRRVRVVRPGELSSRELLYLANNGVDLETIAPPLEVCERTRAVRALCPVDAQR